MNDITTLLQRKSVLMIRDIELRAQFLDTPEDKRGSVESAMDQVWAELDVVSNAIHELDEAGEWDSAMLGREERLADAAYYRMGAL